ncbi:hypothetical protein BsWGS_10435 [Bradybaena similaris]
MRDRLVTILCLLTATPLISEADIAVPITSHWSGGFQGEVCFDATVEMHGWKITLTFDPAITSLEAFTADVGEKQEGGKVFVLTSKAYNGNEHVGDHLCVGFMGHGSGDITPKVTAKVEGADGTVVQPTQGPVIQPTQGPVIQPTQGSVNQPTQAPVTVNIPSGSGVSSSLKVNNPHPDGFEGVFNFALPEVYVGWVVNATFSVDVTNMELYDGIAISHSADGRNWICVNKQDRSVFKPGNLELKFNAKFTGGGTPTGQAVIINMGHDDWSVPTAPDTDDSKYNYNDVLYKSILFYEAQRSGKLPANNRIPWRGDSALNDKGDKGEDLTGGWYDAGDHVKFNFPMAYSTTALAWGYLEYADAYKAAGQTTYFLDSIKWSLDYLLKCHTGPEELYVQVGDAGLDHGYWGAPEKMTMARPAYKITAAKPGCDIAMETAAAMAAGHLVFKNSDPTYAATLLEHAKQLWEFGNKYHGKYSDSVSAAAGYYNSNNFTDELGWGSIWLHRVTNDSKYLAVAEKWFDPDPAWGQSWDEKTVGNQILLYRATGDAKYKTSVENSFKGWLPGGKVPYTPKGLAFRLQWASLRYAANMAMAALIAADMGIMKTELRHWAMCQIHYAIGDTGFSYVIGFGSKYPHSPHHRSSSCPKLPALCGSDVMQSGRPSVHTLYGAMVGGPGDHDDYTDDRGNFVNNEVACDYNAMMQGAVAGLKHLLITGEHPEKLGNANCPYS